MSFAGVSVVTDAKHCTTTAFDVGTDSGYHLLVVKDYSRTVQEIPCGYCINSDHFMVGGHQWYIKYYPNGGEQSCADFISVFLIPWCGNDDDIPEEDVKVHSLFSFVDMVEYQKPMCIRATEPQSLFSKLSGWGCSKFMERDALERSTYLKDDCFTIRCDIVVCKDSSTLDVCGTVSDISQHLDSLLQNKVGADVTFEVSGETFAAHRCVLAARSTVFMAQLLGPMAEGTVSSAIQIKDLEPKVFAALLSFIYTDSFPVMDEAQAVEGHDGEAVEDELPAVEEESLQEEAAERVTWLQDLFMAADKYDLQRLKLLCEEELSEYIGVSSVASTLAVAEQHNCHRLKEACFKFIQVLSPKCLVKVMETDGWEHIRMSYPSLLKELFAKVASSQKDKKRKR